MEGESSEQRYVLRHIPLARRIRNATVAVGGFGGAAALLAAYQASHGLLRGYWFYPAGVAVLGVVCAVLALMEKAWPERVAPAEQAQGQGHEPAKDGKGGTFGSPTGS